MVRIFLQAKTKLWTGQSLRATVSLVLVLKWMSFQNSRLSAKWWHTYTHGKRSAPSIHTFHQCYNICLVISAPPLWDVSCEKCSCWIIGKVKKVIWRAHTSSSSKTVQMVLIMFLLCLHFFLGFVFSVFLFSQEYPLKKFKQSSGCLPFAMLVQPYLKTWYIWQISAWLYHSAFPSFFTLCLWFVMGKSQKIRSLAWRRNCMFEIYISVLRDQGHSNKRINYMPRIGGIWMTKDFGKL